MSMLEEDHECVFFSQCCGAQTSMMDYRTCPECRDHAAFECECGEVYA